MKIKAHMKIKAIIQIPHTQNFSCRITICNLVKYKQKTDITSLWREEVKEKKETLWTQTTEKLISGISVSPEQYFKTKAKTFLKTTQSNKN